MCFSWGQVPPPISRIVQKSKLAGAAEGGELFRGERITPRPGKLFSRSVIFPRKKFILKKRTTFVRANPLGEGGHPDAPVRGDPIDPSSIEKRSEKGGIQRARARGKLDGPSSGHLASSHDRLQKKGRIRVKARGKQ